MSLTDLFSFDRLTDFWGIVREVNPGVVEREAARPVKIIICGAPGDGQRSFAAEITRGGTPDDTVEVYDLTDLPVALPAADAYIYVVRGIEIGSPRTRQHLWQLSRRRGAVLCAVEAPGTIEGSPVTWSAPQLARELNLPAERVVALGANDRRAIESELLPRLFEQVPQLTIPMGRRYPTTRVAAANQLVRETSRVNAEFTVMSSLPDFVPFVGSLATAGADMVVLTKNQAMLLIKLATIHARPTSNRWQLLTEIAPVVGVAFFWRSAARSLVTILPSPLSIAPRVAIAYVGTFVVGRIAAYYYEQGRRPSPDLIDAFAREAANQLDFLRPVLDDVRRRLPLL